MKKLFWVLIAVLASQAFAQKIDMWESDAPELIRNRIVTYGCKGKFKTNEEFILFDVIIFDKWTKDGYDVKMEYDMSPEEAGLILTRILNDFGIQQYEGYWFMTEIADFTIRLVSVYFEEPGKPAIRVHTIYANYTSENPNLNRGYK